MACNPLTDEVLAIHMDPALAVLPEAVVIWAMDNAWIMVPDLTTPIYDKLVGESVVKSA